LPSSPASSPLSPRSASSYLRVTAEEFYGGFVLGFKWDSGGAGLKESDCLFGFAAWFEIR
jgi:hypothetical protein